MTAVADVQTQANHQIKDPGNAGVTSPAQQGINLHTLSHLSLSSSDLASLDQRARLLYDCMTYLNIL